MTTGRRLPVVRLWFEDERRRWQVEWDHAEGKPAVFPTPALALVFAKGSCCARPATIELRAGSLYIVVQQEQGWPKSFF